MDAKGAGEGAEEVFSGALGLEDDPKDVQDSGGRKGADGRTNAGEVPAVAAAPAGAAGDAVALAPPYPAPAVSCCPAGVVTLSWSECCWWLLVDGLPGVASSGATTSPPRWRRGCWGCYGVWGCRGWGCGDDALTSFADGHKHDILKRQIPIGRIRKVRCAKSLALPNVRVVEFRAVQGLGGADDGDSWYTANEFSSVRTLGCSGTKSRSKSEE